MTDRFDEAIDRAVREMLDVEPPVDLRARVVASASMQKRAFVASAFRRNRVVLAAVAAALIVVAVFVARRGEPVAPQPPIVAHAADVRLPAPARAPLRTVAVAPPSAHVTRPVSRGAGTVLAAAYTEDDDGVVADIAPLTRIAPIRIAPIAQDSIAPADLAMPPLNPIADLQIAPLTPPDRRN